MVRRKCVFTTHTPVPAGHDRFSTEQAIRILGGERTARLEKLGCFRDGLLNMTLLALQFSRYANGVAMQHGKVSRAMFPEFSIDSITNGVHAPTWISEPVQHMLDEHIPAWRRDNLTLRNAIDLPEPAMLAAHARAKEESAGRGGIADGAGAESQGADAGICPARGDLQARHAAVHRSGAAEGDCRARPAACRFCMPARRIRRTSRARR